MILYEKIYFWLLRKLIGKRAIISNVKIDGNIELPLGKNTTHYVFGCSATPTSRIMCVKQDVWKDYREMIAVQKPELS